MYCIIQDGALLNVDLDDPFLRNVTIDPDFMTKVFIGGCATVIPGCAMPGGIIADFNLWDRPLSSEEMVDWTACR